MEQMIEQLKQQARDSWPGATGEERAAKIEDFLLKMLAEYSAVLNVPKADLLTAFEKNRTCTAINYYQEANFPSLDGVNVLENLAEFQKRYPSREYRCPSCGGKSNNPYECDSGLNRTNGEACNWKSYGLFGTMGKGMRLTFREGFVDRPKVDEIFMPIEAEARVDADPVNV
ncbi:hypothetical protein [Vogesella sp. XCS3]|uniref:hypothetical protein n=1 Tax=Vogesella sp. XCS3 TaxID=2877939 RepID=UPI001D0A92F6|nr:hypothetical protein [Vogesella sp. XCS3]UDM18871.1 hypothetical protein LCH97_18550 [Vogesella sp. XCS3]